MERKVYGFRDDNYFELDYWSCIKISRQISYEPKKYLGGIFE